MNIDSILNRLTNLAIIGGVLWIGWQVYPHPPQRVEMYKVGETISLPLPPAPTLILVTRSTCPFCTESLPLYREIQRDLAIRIVSVSAENLTINRDYLSQHGIDAAAFYGVDQVTPRVTSTPTLIVLDSAGKVIKSWTGLIPPAEQVNVKRIISEAR